MNKPGNIVNIFLCWKFMSVCDKRIHPNGILEEKKTTKANEMRSCAFATCDAMTNVCLFARKISHSSLLISARDVVSFRWFLNYSTYFSTSSRPHTLCAAHVYVWECVDICESELLHLPSFCSFGNAILSAPRANMHASFPHHMELMAVVNAIQKFE